MDPIRNPFAAGAGNKPPELVGRDEILESATIALGRIMRERHGKSQILLGLRGVGKTVLLRRIEEIAQDQHFLTSFIEASESRSLPALLYPEMHKTLHKLSMVQAAKEMAYHAFRALRSFIGRFQISTGDLSISVDPQPGIADSGFLDNDLSEMFLHIGHAAKAAGRGWAVLIDEVQFLKKDDMAALITAIHHANQKNVPIIFFGGGLPQIAELAGDAKSYAERLFDYPKIGPLNREDAIAAIQQPIINEGETITQDALEEIAQKTNGYPFFLQEWGHQAWNAANHAPITLNDVRQATPNALKRLDESFFRVRFDRLTPKERDYVYAMAKLGHGPYRSADVADILRESLQTLGPRRAQIISKGIIYSPSHGDIDFTAPLFDEFLMRHQRS